MWPASTAVLYLATGFGGAGRTRCSSWMRVSGFDDMASPFVRAGRGTACLGAVVFTPGAARVKEGAEKTATCRFPAAAGLSLQPGVLLPDNFPRRIRKAPIHSSRVSEDWPVTDHEKRGNELVWLAPEKAAKAVSAHRAALWAAR